MRSTSNSLQHSFISKQGNDAAQTLDTTLVGVSAAVITEGQMEAMRPQGRGLEKDTAALLSFSS